MKLIYNVTYTNSFKKQYKKIKKQGKDLSKLHHIITNLANKKELDPKYKNHKLNDDVFTQDAGNVTLNLTGY